MQQRAHARWMIKAEMTLEASKDTLTYCMAIKLRILRTEDYVVYSELFLQALRVLLQRHI